MRNAPLLLLYAILYSCTPAVQKIADLQGRPPLPIVAAPSIPSWGFDPNNQIPDIKNGEWISISSKEWKILVPIDNQTKIIVIGTTKFYQSVHSNVVAAEYYLSSWPEAVILSWTVFTDPHDSCCWFAMKGEDGLLHRSNWGDGYLVGVWPKGDNEVDMVRIILDTVDVGKISRTFKNGATP